MATTPSDDLPPTTRGARRPRSAPADVHSDLPTGAARSRRRARSIDERPDPRPDDATSDAGHAEPLPCIERVSVLETTVDVTAALDRLQEVSAPTLAPLIAWHPLESGVALTHAVPAEAVPLAELRSATPLRSGHVVTVLGAVCEALVALHAAGIVHGAVDADHVLVVPDGSVLLSGCGTAWSRLGDVDGPQPESDVASAGELVRDLLGAGTATSGLVLAALRAADPDPLLRPDAAALLDAVRRSGRAEPLLDLLWLLGRGPHPERIHRAADDDRADGAPPERAPAGRLPLAPGPSVARPPSVHADPRGGRRDPRASAARGRGGPRRRGRAAYVVTAVLASLLVTVGGVLAVRAAGGVAAASETSPHAPAAAPSTSGPPTAPTPSAPPSSPGPGVSEADGAESSASRPGGGTSSATADPSITRDPLSVLDAGQVLDLDHGAAASPPWASVLRAVDAGRLRAICAGSVDELATYVDPAGPAFAADSGLVARVATSGASLRGGGLEVISVRATRSSSTRAVLRVRDRRAAYVIVAGGTTTAVPARASRAWRVTLARGSDGRWRIFEVAPESAPGAAGG